MLKKVYDEVKKILKNNYKSLILFIVLLLACTIEFPYYIEAPGGIIKVDDRVKVENSYEKSGSFNLAYVSEIKATIPTLLYSFVNKNWDVLKKEEVIYDNETMKEADYRDKLLLEEAKNNAVIVAYTNANKKIELSNEHIFIIYVDEKADTDLKIGDEIIEVDGIKITSKKQLDEIMLEKNNNEKIKVIAKRNNKEVECYGTLREENNKKIIGLGVTKTSDIKTTPKIELEFKKSESGPSGGLVLALSIYNSLVSEDITQGRKIVGTGTIDVNGNVGSIGGVEYKIKGAVKEKADIFLVPAGENYEEAQKVIEENNYKIKLIPVTTFNDALEKLK